MLLEGKRIFYIEDDIKNRLVSQVILEREGAVVNFENWGRDLVLPRLHSFAPVDLILLDLMFPRGVTGYDIFDHIRSNEAFESTPIVAVSAADATVEIPKARAKGFAGFISKPINLRDFPEQVAAVLDGAQSWHLA
jgi:CheY-like chemotaxis protein